MLRVNYAPQVTAKSMGLIYPMSISHAEMLKQLLMSLAGMEFLHRVQFFHFNFSSLIFQNDKNRFNRIKLSLINFSNLVKLQQLQ